MAVKPQSLGGYDYHFLEPPLDMLVCKICQYPSREAYLSGCCGHTFCKSCLELAKKATNTDRVTDVCPTCYSEEFVTFPNKQVDRTVKKLHVSCTNKEKGCEWQGEVNDIINQLGNSDGCQFEDVTCSNDCGKCLQRQYLTGHVEDDCVRRKVDCQYCHITGEHQFIEGEHNERCPKFPIVCPNKCEADNIPREDMDEHRKMCPLEVVTCPNDCGMTLQRQYLTIHAKMECPRLKIDCQYCHITGEHQFIEGEHKEQCPKFPIACPNKCKVGSVPRDDVEEHMKMCPLELIQCEYHMVGCEERMARKDQKKHNKEKMGEHLCLTKENLQTTQEGTKGELAEMTKSFADALKELADTKADLKSTQEEARKTKDNLTQQLAVTKQEAKNTKGELTQKLTNTQRDLNTTKQQLATTCQNLAKAEKEHITLAANTDEVLAKLETKFQTKITKIETAAQKRITELETNLKQKTQQIDKLLLITWGMDIVLMASKISSGDQVVPVIVKVSEYTKKKSDKVKWYSDSFYTHHKGYKMCLLVDVGGWSTRSGYLTVHLFLMKGPYDDQLRWPLKGHCEMKLLNQISNSEHHLGNGRHKGDAHERITSGERSYYYSIIMVH
ncbi:TNF receptor-associated factor 2-like [Dysidea avara]|uniref:TNF receptor-associated factor 2-like n=1 Tax=Dysidea avara TaxID=196820 RepID=UPI00332715E4